MLDLIGRLGSFGIDVVVSSHVLRDIERTCDWVVMLDEGTLLHAGPLGGHDDESRQCAVLSNLCLVYGGFVLLLVLIPNPLAGRLIILCCSSIVAAIGLFLKSLSRRYRVA